MHMNWQNARGPTSLLFQMRLDCGSGQNCMHTNALITEAHIKERVREEIGKIKSIMRVAYTIIQLYIEPVQHMSCLSIIFVSLQQNEMCQYVFTYSIAISILIYLYFY